MDAKLPTGETFSEGSDLPPMPPMAGGPMELAVPLASLAQPDDKEQLQTPGQGDVVTLQVEAEIVRVDGTMAYIKPRAVNGNALDEAEALTPEADAAEGAALRGEALML